MPEESPAKEKIPSAKAIRLADPVNEFAFEGNLLLPPLKVNRKNNVRTACLFCLGYTTTIVQDGPEGKVKKTVSQRVTFSAVGDLANQLLGGKFKLGQHLLVRGGFQSYSRQFSAPRVSVLAQSIEPVRRKRREDADAAMLREVLE